MATSIKLLNVALLSDGLRRTEKVGAGGTDAVNDLGKFPEQAFHYEGQIPTGSVRTDKLKSA